MPEGETGTVSGKVTYKGNAAPEGSAITFINSANGLVGSGTIGADGSYSLTMKGGSDILAGTYAVGVSPPPVEEPDLSNEEAMKASMEGKTAAPKEWPEIPEKYRTPETSGETFEVKAGANTYDLDMKDAPASAE